MHFNFVCFCALRLFISFATFRSTSPLQSIDNKHRHRYYYFVSYSNHILSNVHSFNSLCLEHFYATNAAKKCVGQSNFSFILNQKVLPFFSLRKKNNTKREAEKERERIARVCMCFTYGFFFIKVVEQIQVMSSILSTIFLISVLGKSPIHFTYQNNSFVYF